MKRILCATITGTLLITSPASKAGSYTRAMEEIAQWTCSGERNREGCEMAYEFFSVLPTLWPASATMTVGAVSEKISKSLSRDEKSVIALAQSEGEELLKNYDPSTDGFKVDSESGETPSLSHNFSEAVKILQAKLSDIEELDMPEGRKLKNLEAAIFLSSL